MKHIYQKLRLTSICVLLHIHVFSQELTPLQKIEKIYPSDQYTMDNDFQGKLLDLLTYRVRIHENTKFEDDKNPLLSSFSLQNKYAPELRTIIEEGYHPDSFNVLKYNLPFFNGHPHSSFYKIDNTNLTLEILPQ